MKLDYISQMSQSTMPLKLNSPSVEGEVEEEEEVTKEEGAVKVTLIAVEETYNGTQINTSKDIDNIIRIRVSNLKEAEGEDHMRNQTYNTITAKSMGTMNLNARRSKQIIS
jgi:hypothetical protein